MKIYVYDRKQICTPVDLPTSRAHRARSSKASAKRESKRDKTGNEKRPTFRKSNTPGVLHFKSFPKKNIGFDLIRLLLRLFLLLFFFN